MKEAQAAESRLGICGSGPGGEEGRAGGWAAGREEQLVGARAVAAACSGGGSSGEEQHREAFDTEGGARGCNAPAPAAAFAHLLPSLPAIAVATAIT